MQILEIDGAHYLEFQGNRHDLHIVEDDGYTIFDWDPPAKFYINELGSLKASDIPQGLRVASLYQSGTYPPLSYVQLERDADFLKLYLDCSYMWSEWSGVVKMDVFIEKLFSEVEKHPGFKCECRIDPHDVDCSIKVWHELSLGENLLDSLEAIANKFSIMHKTTLAALEKEKLDSVLVSTFQFPEIYKSILCQYLVYFGDFLSDLGVQADSSIENRDGLTILSVSPVNKQDAIQNIYRVLMAYLSLPMEGFADSVIPSSDPIAQIKYQQILSLIDYMKSQIRLKDATIHAQNLSIAALQTSLKTIDSQNVLLASLKSVESTENEKISVMGGGLTITEYKGKFYTVNFSKLVSYLKSVFR